MCAPAHCGSMLLFPQLLITLEVAFRGRVYIAELAGSGVTEEKFNELVQLLEGTTQFEFLAVRRCKANHIALRLPCSFVYHSVYLSYHAVRLNLINPKSGTTAIWYQ